MHLFASRVRLPCSRGGGSVFSQMLMERADKQPETTHLIQQPESSTRRRIPCETLDPHNLTYIWAQARDGCAEFSSYFKNNSSSAVHWEY